MGGNVFCEMALESYLMATKIAPNKAAFWVGVTLVDTDRVDEVVPFLMRAYAQDSHLADLIPRFPRSGLLLGKPDLNQRLIE